MIVPSGTIRGVPTSVYTEIQAYSRYERRQDWSGYNRRGYRDSDSAVFWGTTLGGRLRGCAAARSQGITRVCEDRSPFGAYAVW